MDIAVDIDLRMVFVDQRFGHCLGEGDNSVRQEAVGTVLVVWSSFGRLVGVEEFANTELACTGVAYTVVVDTAMVRTGYSTSEKGVSVIF